MTLSDEAFVRAIAEQPNEVGVRLAYADWLEEQGDPRAAKVREACRHRLPITSAERRHLTAIAAARQEASAQHVRLEVRGNTPAYPLTDGSEGRGAFADDVRHLAPDEIARHFPRDDRGRFQDCTVLLARYRSAGPLPRGRDLWLTAVGPVRRGDAQEIVVRLEPLFSENHGHNWSASRWHWDQRSLAADERTRWGIKAAELRAVTGPRGEARVAKLKAKAEAGKLSATERIALGTAWQDQGRFEDALRLHGIDYPDDMSRLLNGERFRFTRGCDHPKPEAMAARAPKLRRALWEMAPWRLHQALALSREIRRGSRSSGGPLRLFIFPGAPHARKPGLMLVPDPAGQPRLTIDFSGSNTVAAETFWKRPVELDIARWHGA
jgi:uncharacterized protein (TIGR02996 family)